MEWFKLLLFLSLVIMVFASLQLYQFWNRFKKLKIGDPLSNEFVAEVSKKLKVAIIFLGIGCILGLMGILMRTF